MLKVGNSGKWIYILLSLITGSYIILRAICFPFITDEVATFFMYVQTGRFLPPDIAWDANNHILNSALVRLSYLLFGPSIFTLRLPELLFVPVYFYFVYKTGTLIANSVVRWTFYIAMFGTHYIIEYFGFARGYGMSLALLSGAVWYLILSVRQFGFTNVLKTLLLTFLAVSANLNLIITYILIFGLLIFYYFLNVRRLKKWEALLIPILFLFAGLGLWVFTDYSFTLLEKGRLYCGSSDGIIESTIYSLSNIIYNGLPLIFTLYFIGVVFLTTSIYMYMFLKKKEMLTHPSPGILFWVLLAGNIFAGVAMHYLFGVLYQEDRMAIYYLPLFYGLCVFAVDTLVENYGRKLIFILAPVWLIPLFSLGQISLESSSHDSTPYVPRSFFKEISSTVNQGDYPPVVAGVHKRKLVWSYYNYLNDGRMNPILFSDDPVLYADYLMYNFDMREKPLELYEDVDYDASSGLSLMKRKKKPESFLLAAKTLKNIPLELKKEYFKILEVPVDTVNADAFIVCFDFEIESDAIPFEGTFVCELRDSTGARLAYEALNLDQMHPVWNKNANKVHHSLMPVAKELHPASVFIYFWNKRKVSYRIVKGRTTVSFLR